MQKKEPTRGRPSKGASAYSKTIQVCVNPQVERHVKAQGGSAFVRTLIEKDMKKAATPKAAAPKPPAIKNGPKPAAVKTAMTDIRKPGIPTKEKSALAEVGPYREAALKEGAPKKPTPKPAPKPEAKKPAAKPAPKPAAKAKAKTSAKGK